MQWLDKIIDIAIGKRLSPEALDISGKVRDYLDTLPEDRQARIISKIIGAGGLTEPTVRKMMESIKGDKYIEIFFANGDTAIISNRKPAEKVGPGW